MSAVSTGKGVIFVEAFREAHVKAAVTGIADLYSWKDGAITLVPLPEMTRVVRCCFYSLATSCTGLQNIPCASRGCMLLHHPSLCLISAPSFSA